MYVEIFAIISKNFITLIFVLCWRLHRGYGDLYHVGKKFFSPNFLQCKGGWAWRNFYISSKDFHVYNSTILVMIQTGGGMTFLTFSLCNSFRNQPVFSSLMFIPYSGKFLWGPIFAEGQSSKFSQFNFRGCARSCSLYTVQSCLFRGSNFRG